MEEQKSPPADINRSGLLSAILIWAMEDSESIQEAAIRLNVPARRFAAETYELERTQVVVKVGKNNRRRGSNPLAMLSFRRGLDSPPLNETLQRVLGDRPITPGEIYNVEEIAIDFCRRVQEARGKSIEGGP